MTPAFLRSRLSGSWWRRSVKGLLVDGTRAQIVLGQTTPPEFLPKYVEPNPKGILHISLSGALVAAGILPAQEGQPLVPSSRRVGARDPRRFFHPRVRDINRTAGQTAASVCCRTLGPLYATSDSGRSISCLLRRRVWRSGNACGSSILRRTGSGPPLSSGLGHSGTNPVTTNPGPRKSII